jgi:hypothetical protein
MEKGEVGGWGGEKRGEIVLTAFLNAGDVVFWGSQKKSENCDPISNLHQPLLKLLIPKASQVRIFVLLTFAAFNLS